MKSRSGFVSNSSSTSFVILVKPDKAQSVEFILKHLKAFGDKPILTVPERKKELRKEIREIDKDLIYVDGIYDRVNNMPEQSFSDHDYLVLTASYNRLRKDAIRCIREYPNSFDTMSKEEYLTRIARLKEDLQEDRAENEKQLKLLEGNEKWSIISFEEDANWGHLRHMVDELVDRGDAVVLIKETT